MGDEILVLAKSRLELLKEPYEVIAEHKGKEMVGMQYEPLYPFVDELAGESERPKLEKAFKVYTADFVTTEDGTGIVHTAVMYGQDDFVLGTKEGLPKVHLVNPEGMFIKGTGWLEGRLVVESELAVEILKDLQAKERFFAKENHTHSYPFCWRCKTRLIYYARDSWYIRMSELRSELVKENEKINWEPEYIKEGRFGEWLREVKDWAISRERYWGTPLPVWLSADGSKKIVADSIDTLRKFSKTSGNRYFVMRHGGTDGNKHEIVSFKNEAKDGLTDEGKKEAEKAGYDMKSKGIDLIVASPFIRTKETAEIVRKSLGLPESALVFDERLIEVNPGEFDGKNWNEYHDYVYNIGTDWYERRIPGGESLAEVGKRVGESLYDLEKTYQGKKILIITHGGPAWLAYVASGLYQPDHKQYKKADTHVFIDEFKRFKNAEVRELPFVPLPHDENFKIDLHKPFIDDITLIKDGEEYTRTKEVMDVWLDSGSMPFAQDASSREKPSDFSHINYPADYISEAIDQTRGWFYTLHAVGVLMGRGRAFNNAICLGHILDKEGKKMSKSVGNILDPWELMDKYGVDTLRLWMYSVNQPGESKNFDERSVDEVQKRVFNLLDNMFTFYELYRDTSIETNEMPESNDVLDQWILSRLSQLNTEMSKKLDAYKLLEPVRELRAFIDDFSTWYVRRSRDRLKEGDRDAKKTMYFVLKTLSKLLAPFAPFAAEDLYQKLKLPSDPISVHLESWPNIDALNNEVIMNMAETRRISSLGLEARSRANIKIRQPLQSLSVKLGSAYSEIIKDEVNVKEVINAEREGVELDTILTPELMEEGEVRELVRKIQDIRKEKGLKPGDVMQYKVEEGEHVLFDKYGDEIVKTTNILIAK